MKEPGCPLCEGPGGRIVFSGARFRVIHAQEDASFPAFYRVVWNEHVREFSDLPGPDRALCMQAVVDVEEALRTHLQPTKVNVASLGNVVAHLHWHVVARFAWDSHFPAPIWAAASRAAPLPELARIEALLPALERQIAARLAGSGADRTGP